MKKDLKKLSLDRQTIRTLSQPRLVDAAGAMPNNTRSCLGGCGGTGGTGGTGGSATWGFDCATQTLPCLSNLC